VKRPWLAFTRPHETKGSSQRDNKALAAVAVVPENDESGLTIAPAERVIDLRRSVFAATSLIWLCITSFGLVRLVHEWKQLQVLRRIAAPLDHAALQSALSRICRSLGLSRKVSLLSSSQVTSPLTAGICQPFVLFPTAYFSSRGVKRCWAPPPSRLTSRPYDTSSDEGRLRSYPDASQERAANEFAIPYDRTKELSRDVRPDPIESCRRRV